ncbi:nascent polypeptide-associated complex subunit alpha, muscle-specific form-like [Littorina saxatilis]|uniref:nascent polypeptide-associated complex subunit alpha, muscle-specific form-like n=1 Tax=Littorina saxatilis TaxID=31220 RepID=UPI0038B6513E
MFVILLAFLCTAPSLTLSQCPPGCSVCCKGNCCSSGQSCCDSNCQASCEQDKTAVWIIVGIVVAIIAVLVSICLIIGCIYCCSKNANRKGTAVTSFRQPPSRARRTYAGTNGRSPRPNHQPRDDDSPRVWSLSDPKKNLTFSSHSPRFAPPTPGFVVPGGSSTVALPLSPRPLGLPASPRSPRIPTAPLPAEFSQQESSPENRKEPADSGEEEDVESKASLKPSTPNNAKGTSSSTTLQPSGSKSDKPLFTKSPKVSSASRFGAMTPAGSGDPRTPRNVEITSLDSDDDDVAVYGEETIKVSLPPSTTKKISQ